MPMTNQDDETITQFHVRSIQAEAWDRGFMDAAKQDHPAHPRTRKIENPYLRPGETLT